MNHDIADVRRNYSGSSLDAATAPDAPFPLFQEWLDEALAREADDPNAMTLATVDSQGHPHARIVLLKGFDEQGFVFYTNYQSHKGSELANVPHAALVFWWPKLQRQVRIEGRVKQVDGSESDRYFQSRPRNSQLSAWIALQSVEIPDREWLEERKQRFEKVYDGQTVHRPRHWGGYRVVPEMVEFWQGQADRLHDRVRYSRHDQEWFKARLAP
ncbi:Pyridoxamine 5'-phosphate oxidase [Modicisalibacter ilicicola DSM 19980]|uniref:Pyridoxine/pyridoxamine 5'-phosphate oxidase n=1 Tax=Modicisalibacter ilicicola DSM 19980 TaxID=1121942 RepID=A0A1M4XJP2_9GAMM|nr:pyridoxamine 5'-phosphate oxidase [Halomonas ilicicola]SHE93620.1 Pyridoxamine 5'-phosphate oxidase [Halomonas ilicicola DSM 19980]